MTVQHTTEQGLHEVDLALPSSARVGELLPAIVDVVHGDGFTPVTEYRWRLARLGGQPVDEAISLAENQIHDGTVLMLTATDPPPPRRVVRDPSHVLAAGAAQCSASGWAAIAGCLMICGVAAASLGWPGVGGRGHAFVGGGLAVAAAGAAVLADRHSAARALVVPVSVVAAFFAAAAGCRAVPGGSPTAHVLLACAAAGTVAVVTLRITGCGTVVLTSIALFCALSTGVAAAAVTWRLSVAAAGALLGTLALAALSLAPRMTIALTGIGPPMPSVEDMDVPAIDEAVAAVAHRVLSGLVIGASGAACGGGVLVVVDGLREHTNPLSALVFTTVVGIVLLLRARTHVHATRCVAMVMCGMVCVTVCFAAAAVAWPELAHWTGVAAAGTGVAALTPLLRLEPSAATLRAVELVEYLAAATVIPLACWVAGVYGLVRGLGLR